MKDVMSNKEYIKLSSPPAGGDRGIHNFNAGPSILPKEVFEKASHAILDYNNTGLSILEIGHRYYLIRSGNG